MKSGTRRLLRPRPRGQKHIKRLNPPKGGRALLARPQLDVDVRRLSHARRIAEVGRYQIQRLEYWLSPSGRLRDSFRWLLWLALILAAFLTILGPVTSCALEQANSWIRIAAEIADNASKIPFGIGKLLLSCGLCIAAVRLLFRR